MCVPRGIMESRFSSATIAPSQACQREIVLTMMHPPAWLASTFLDEWCGIINILKDFHGRDNIVFGLETDPKLYTGGLRAQRNGSFKTCAKFATCYLNGCLRRVDTVCGGPQPIEALAKDSSTTTKQSFVILSRYRWVQDRLREAQTDSVHSVKEAWRAFWIPPCCSKLVKAWHFLGIHRGENTRYKQNMRSSVIAEYSPIHGSSYITAVLVADSYSFPLCAGTPWMPWNMTCNKEKNGKWHAGPVPTVSVNGYRKWKSN